MADPRSPSVPAALGNPFGPGDPLTSADPLDPAAAARRAERSAQMRTHAATLRAEADAIESHLRDLAAYDRPDVWQGARATDFRNGFDEQRRRLTAPITGVSAELREAARRIDLRAEG